MAPRWPPATSPASCSPAPTRSTCPPCSCALWRTPPSPGTAGSRPSGARTRSWCARPTDARCPGTSTATTSPTTTRCGSRSSRVRSASSPELRAARRDHPVGVEHAVHVAQAVHGHLQRLGVGHLDHEAVLDHRLVDDAARLDDVHAALGERAREVLEQAVAVPRVDLDLDLERGLVVAVPGDGDEAVGVLAQRLGVRAVL